MSLKGAFDGFDLEAIRKELEQEAQKSEVFQVDPVKVETPSERKRAIREIKKKRVANIRSELLKNQKLDEQLRQAWTITTSASVDPETWLRNFNPPRRPVPQSLAIEDEVVEDVIFDSN